MDIAKIQFGGEWLDLNIDSKNKDGEDLTLKVKIKPLSESEKYSIHKKMKEVEKTESVDEFADEIMALILDWDIFDDGKPIECTKENKARVIPYLIGMKVKSEDSNDDENNYPNRIERVIIRVKLESIKKSIESDEKESAISSVNVLNNLMETEKPLKNVGISILTFAGQFNNFIKN